MDTMFSPNPAPSTAGSGYTRARTPHGGMSPTALKRIVPHGDDHRGADGDRGRVTELPAFLPLLSSPLFSRLWSASESGGVTVHGVISK
jgi:hypothetical protein